MRNKPSQRALPASGTVAEGFPGPQEQQFGEVPPGDRLDEIEDRIEKRRRVATDILELVHDLEQVVDAQREHIEHLERRLDHLEFEVRGGER